MNGDDDRTQLSQREHEVCELVILGLSTKEVARRLGISPRTVDDHRQRVYRKLDVHNVVSLVRKLLVDNHV